MKDRVESEIDAPRFETSAAR